MRLIGQFLMGANERRLLVLKWLVPGSTMFIYLSSLDSSVTRVMRNVADGSKNASLQYWHPTGGLASETNSMNLRQSSTHTLSEVS